MIPLLWTVATLSAVLAAAAFGLTLLAIRRLREMRERLDTIAEPFGPSLPELGEPVPPFVAPTAEGGEVTEAALAGSEVTMLFLTTDCSGCRDLAEDLLAAPEKAIGPGGPPIAVIMGPERDRTELVAELAPLARVVTEPDPGGLAARLGVRAFPAVLVAGGGVVRAAGHSLSVVSRA